MNLKPFYKSIKDVPPEILAKYRAGKYRFSVPPVCTTRWDELAWINWVVFDID